MSQQNNDCFIARVIQQAKPSDFNNTQKSIPLIIEPEKVENTALQNIIREELAVYETSTSESEEDSDEKYRFLRKSPSKKGTSPSAASSSSPASSNLQHTYIHLQKMLQEQSSKAKIVGPIDYQSTQILMGIKPEQLEIPTQPSKPPQEAQLAIPRSFFSEGTFPIFQACQMLLEVVADMGDVEKEDSSVIVRKEKMFLDDIRQQKVYLLEYDQKQNTTPSVTEESVEDADEEEVDPTVSDREKSIQEKNNSILTRLQQSTRNFKDRFQKFLLDMENRESQTLTFQPVLSPRSRNIINNNLKDSGHLSARLDEVMKLKKQKLDDKQKELDEKLKSQLTFSPQILPYGNNTTRTKQPIEQSLQAWQKLIDKKKKDRTEKEASKQDPNLTFRPIVSPRSSRLAENKKKYKIDSSNQ